MTNAPNCERCGADRARSYVRFHFAAVGDPPEDTRSILCVPCARARRCASPSSEGIDRRQSIEELNRFFEESGIDQICAQCHRRGTGCCPSTCRRMTADGCRGKTLWCAAFVCSALLVTIDECDPRTARLLKWVSRQVGPAEYPLYQIIARVPFRGRCR